VAQHTSPAANVYNLLGGYWYYSALQFAIYNADELDPEITEIRSVSFYVRPPTAAMDTARHFALFIYETPDNIIPATGMFPAPIVMATPPCGTYVGLNCSTVPPVNVATVNAQIAAMQAAGMHLVEYKIVRQSDYT
jgi:hypothetical protein